MNDQQLMEQFWGHMARLAPPGGIKDRVFRIDAGKWVLRANGHRVKTDGVPPFSVMVEFNGWPAGIIDPGGAVIAAGSLANLQTLVDALAEVPRG